MHLRVQRFQTRVVEQICSLQSICQHSECCPRVRFHSFSRFPRLLSSETQFSMTLVDRIVFPNCSIRFSLCSNLLSLDARRSKCIFYMLKCALARRESIQMRVLCAQMRSRSTPVDPNVFSMCSCALSLDACRWSDPH